MTHLTDSARSPGAAAALAATCEGTERRVTVRHACQPGTLANLHPCGARWHVAPEGRILTALLCDISASGLGLLLGISVEAGTILEVDLQGLRGGRTLIARVVHVTASARGWRHGCELASLLSEAELHELASDAGAA